MTERRSAAPERPCSCGKGHGRGHEHDCSWWPRRRPDPLDDPYARGLAEDDYLAAMFGEPRRGVEW